MHGNQGALEIEDKSLFPGGWNPYPIEDVTKHPLVGTYPIVDLFEEGYNVDVDVNGGEENFANYYLEESKRACEEDLSGAQAEVTNEIEGGTAEGFYTIEQPVLT